MPRADELAAIGLPRSVREHLTRVSAKHILGPLAALSLVVLLDYWQLGDSPRELLLLLALATLALLRGWGVCTANLVVNVSIVEI